MNVLQFESFVVGLCDISNTVNMQIMTQSNTIS